MKNAFDSNICCSSLNYCSVHRTKLHRTRLYKTRTQIVEANTVFQRANVRTDMNCMICKKLVKIIQTQLKDNATDEQIVNVLNEVCILLPSNEKPHCHEVVTQYA